ncbi:MAG: sigma-70 family RNA polymerase sigma factor [Leptolyngbyaceae bacterium]|nr:sigma-70 family RNA polymerase sigma factor [Leptolyngbyaceae bacterium]
MQRTLLLQNRRTISQSSCVAAPSNFPTQHDQTPHLVGFQKSMAPDIPSTSHPVTAQSTDLELLNAIKVGQVDGLSTLYDRYATLLCAIARRVLNNPEEAEDIMQEVFLKIWKQPFLYDHSRGSFSNFLVTMTRSRAIDKLRSRGAQFRFLQRWQVSVSSIYSETLLESVSVEERSELVRSAMTTLSSNERQVLEISYYEGLSYPQIAERLNVPLGTVKSRARTGLQKLRHALNHTL